MKMNQLLLVYLLTYIINSATAQDYVPMSIDNSTWIMASTNENPIYNDIIVLRLEGDTIVNNFEYAKIYYYICEDFKVLIKTRKLIGLFRDDIVERKVYGGILEGSQGAMANFINPDARCVWTSLTSFNEHLLYDFSLQLGDTIDVCMLAEPTIITRVDSIDRFGYKRLNYKLGDKGYHIMTEGIGTCIGIFKGFSCIITGGGFSYGLANYCVGSFSDCSILTPTIEESLSSSIVIRPNPVSDRLYLDIPENMTATYKVIDLNGRLCMSGEIIQSGILVSKLDLGIYFVSIYDGFSKPIQVMKFTKL